jgi:hypothetical protein
MDIRVNGATTSNATTNDIASAIKAQPDSGNWSITLERGDGDYFQAFYESGARYRLTCKHEGGQFDGKELVAPKRLQNILTHYLNDDPAWRKAIAWKRGVGNEDGTGRTKRAEDRLSGHCRAGSALGGPHCGLFLKCPRLD